ncbi:MAG: hypothetical protein HKO65_11285 [Gemmatimonadetes bacterium]|nr:hypothetical protein [Gemmatimonadota bacterium]NNM05659.1 hypothetical protein [Gemmatimonadota bacterium]
MAETIAEGLAQDAFAEGLEFRSAGTHAAESSPASGGAQRTAARRGRSLSAHRSTPLSRELVGWADWVLVMSPGHLDQVERLGGVGKVALLGAFAFGEGEESGTTSRHPLAVPDPFGGDDERYDETYRTLERYVNMALRRLVESREE